MIQPIYADFNPAQRDHIAPAPILPRFLAWIKGLVMEQVYVLGVDLSHWETVDFSVLKRGGFEYVILKATEGTGFVDSTFDVRWRQALDNDFIVGPYHFFRSNLDGTLQAEHHLRTIEPLLDATGGHIIPPANDVETADGVSVATRQSRIQAYHSRMRSVFGDILCYSSPYLWQTLTNNMALDCYSWTAHWTSAAVPSWPVGHPIIERKLWQRGIYPRHSWIPYVPGVNEADVDYFFGNLDDLKRWIGLPVLSHDEQHRRLWNAHPELW